MVRNTTYRPIFKIFFWMFIADFGVLTWIGQMPVKDIYAAFGRLLTIGYFAFFLILLPVSGKIEHYLAMYKVDKD